MEKDEKTIVFDTGPLISLATNNLLWMLKPLKQAFNGRFCITQGTRYELIDHPLATKRFKFEALQVLELLRNQTLEVIGSSAIKASTLQILDSANHAYTLQGRGIVIVQYAEMECLAAAVQYGASAVVVDERTTRLLLEAPHLLKSILASKMNVKIELDHEKLAAFKGLLGRDIAVLRSAELVTIAFELGILDRFVADIPNAKRTLLESVLWGVKLHGCSIANREIEQILKLEKV